APHWSFESQLKGTPASICGKYCRPMPMSAVSADCTKASSAPRTESHFVAPAAAPGSGSSIEPDVSSMMNRSSPIGSATRVSPKHVAPMSAPSGPRSPKPSALAPGPDPGAPASAPAVDPEPAGPGAGTSRSDSDEHPTASSPIHTSAVDLIILCPAEVSPDSASAGSVAPTRRQNRQAGAIPGESCTARV